MSDTQTFFPDPTVDAYAKAHNATVEKLQSLFKIEDGKAVLIGTQEDALKVAEQETMYMVSLGKDAINAGLHYDGPTSGSKIFDRADQMFDFAMGQAHFWTGAPNWLDKLLVMIATGLEKEAAQLSSTPEIAAFDKLEQEAFGTLSGMFNVNAGVVTLSPQFSEEQALAKIESTRASMKPTLIKAFSTANNLPYNETTAALVEKIRTASEFWVDSDSTQILTALKQRAAGLNP